MNLNNDLFIVMSDKQCDYDFFHITHSIFVISALIIILYLNQKGGVVIHLDETVGTLIIR